MNLRGIVDWALVKLDDLPTVALAKCSLLLLDWATLALVAAICIWKNTNDSVPALNAWLMLLAALHGVSYANFRTAVQSPSTAPSGASMATLPQQPTPPPPPPLTVTTTTTAKTGDTP